MAANIWCLHNKQVKMFGSKRRGFQISIKTSVAPEGKETFHLLTLNSQVC